MNDFNVNAETPDWVANLPDEFHGAFLGVQLWQWIGLVLLIGLASLAMLIGHKVAGRILRARDKYLPGQISQETHYATRRAAGLLSGVLVCYPFIGPLNLPPKFDRGVNIALQAATILAFAMAAYAVWDTVCDSMANRAAGVSERAERLLVPLTRKFIRALIVIVAFVIALSTLFNVNVAAVIASLGIGGIVVALAAKDSVENIIGSVTLLFDMPFAIGDTVKIDKIEGIVEEINLRSTRIRTFEDSVINLPNANLIRAAVENVSSRRYRRQKINVRVSYDTPPDKLNALCHDLREFLSGEDKVDSERIIVDLSELDDTAMTVLVQCHFEAETQAVELEMRHKLLAEIARLRIKHGVLFYPAGVGRLPTA
jgi:MscS family membrane protein